MRCMSDTRSPQTERGGKMCCRCGGVGTGQVEVFVAPTVMVHVLQNGSVLETLISSWAEACVRERSL